MMRFLISIWRFFNPVVIHYSYRIEYDESGRPCGLTMYGFTETPRRPPRSHSAQVKRLLRSAGITRTVKR